MKTALLLSGGMDSTALAWWLRPDIAITIDYGQLAAEAEIHAAGVIAGALSIEHHVITVDCRAIGSGDMAGSHQISVSPTSEWWPFRNQLLITLAAMKALSLNATRLLIATVGSDGVHKDGDIGFIQRLHDLLSFQEGALSLEAPAIKMTTTELIVSSKLPLQLLAWTHSCHKSNAACGTCRGCNKHLNVYDELESNYAPA